jgi:hypothetical protein
MFGLEACCADGRKMYIAVPANAVRLAELIVPQLTDQHHSFRVDAIDRGMIYGIETSDGGLSLAYIKCMSSKICATAKVEKGWCEHSQVAPPFLVRAIEELLSA